MSRLHISPQRALTQLMTSQSIKPTKHKTMKTETTLHLENGETLTLQLHDNRDLIEAGETCIESHLHYPTIGRYQIFYVPESWNKNELYTRESGGAYVRKVIYHLAPVEETETN